MTRPPASHFEAFLQRDIDLIRARLLKMSDLDEHALVRAFEALLKRDRQLAYSVILHDQDVDALETELDRLCLEFIVRHQPAAGHLRFVYSASKVVNDLERVGDYAESIARQILLISSLSFDVPMDKFKELTDLAIPMLHNAVRAFVDKNAELARSTMASEPRVNEVRDSLTADLLDWREQERLPLEALAPLITVARRFERVSDQAMNICEEALYFATGEYLRHLPREAFRVLFVDDGNACLSRMAEAIANRLAGSGFCFASTGVEARAADPQTIGFLKEKGLDIPQEGSRSIDQVADLHQVQVIVALCKQAERVFPQKPTKSKTLGLHWFVADPSKVRGTPEQVRAAYEAAFESLTSHINDLLQAIVWNGQDSANENLILPS